ncbi:uncharacterized protein LOC143079991 isoform X2 [Mytilus galloprovincialis]|uniref:uncharacterized protein LOC143079991 isoform X2 n=1 Tax=Mytilus galloprovincialis TaxID=29158 RepID=UPI003F7BB681
MIRVSCILSTLIVCILIGHVIGIQLTVSPDYILGGNPLALNCSVDHDVNIETFVTFSKDATLIGYIQNCKENGITSCSSTPKCHCDSNSEYHILNFIWNYTPSNENMIDATFGCTLDASESVIRVKKAVFTYTVHVCV